MANLVVMQQYHHLVTTKLFKLSSNWTNSNSTNLRRRRRGLSITTNLIKATSSSSSSPGAGEAAAAGGVSGLKSGTIMEIPLDKIRRPLMRTRSNDPEKVDQLMHSIQQIGLQVPIDVLEVDGVYYGFSGCHRYEAHQRLGLPTIRCKIRRGTKETLRHHLR